MALDDIEYKILDPHHPLLSIRVRGLWQQQYIFYVSRGRQLRRVASSYDLSAKGHLVPYQGHFAEGIAAWRALSPATKRRLNSHASRAGLRYSGYNYFLHLWLTSSKHLSKYYPG